ncbi:MAG: hypothetical protein [brine shrimp arlivirus 5]|nr:MAG: hypothetical protein [brine shrimp arlivirus 5]
MNNSTNKPQRALGKARVSIIPPGKLIETPCTLMSPLNRVIRGDEITSKTSLGPHSSVDVLIYVDGLCIAKIHDIFSHIRGGGARHEALPQQISVQSVGPLSYTPIESSQNIVEQSDGPSQH